MNRGIVFSALALLIAVAIWALTNPKRPVDPRVEIPARTTREFPRAELLKPLPLDDSLSGLERELQPLFLIELPAGASSETWARFGTMRIDAGEPRVVASPPKVYVTSTRASWDGTEHAQFLYAWWHRNPDRSPAAPPWIDQGVRVTLDDRSMPAVWEVLRDSSGLRVVYVSSSLEKAAREEFGPPLEGRRFSVERSLAETPDVVVARVLSDGPVPMGPWVYLLADSLDVSTLLCRCMDSQVEEIHPGNTGYALEPLESLEELLESFGGGFPPLSETLGESLRLPGSL